MATIQDMLHRIPSPHRGGKNGDGENRGGKSAGKSVGKSAGKSRAKSLLQAGVVALLAGLIAFSVYQLARHMTVGLNTLRTQKIVDDSYVRLELYLFRDEQLLYAEGSDVCLYTVRDGERVGVGDSFGTAYAVGDGAMAADLQERLNAYGDRIALLEEIGGLGTPADARAEADAVNKRYLGLLNAVSRGDLAAVEGYADGMLDGIGRYDILTGATGDGATVASLEAERAALMAGATAVGNLTTDRSGYFYYEADGFESVFDYSTVMTMTAAEFFTMTEQSAQTVPAGVVGKMVWSPVWYAAAYVTADEAAVFQSGLTDGTSYTMLCGDSGDLSIDMTVERIVPDGDNAMVVFSTTRMPEGFSYDRCLRAETVSYSVSGYRIPTEALVTLRSEETGKDVTGVYVLAGNVVEFRKVRTKARRDGYIIAETYTEVQSVLESLDEAQYEAMTADGWDYLNLNDNIITSGNELYEGKVIG